MSRSSLCNVLAVLLFEFLDADLNDVRSVTPADLRPSLQEILGNLLNILDIAKNTPQQLAENDYVMKGRAKSVYFFFVFLFFFIIEHPPDC